MTQKVALHSREQDLPPELAYFQACRRSIAKELVVCIDLFVRSIYKYFIMLISETHQGLRPLGYLGNKQVVTLEKLIMEAFIFCEQKGMNIYDAPMTNCTEKIGDIFEELHKAYSDSNGK